MSISHFSASQIKLYQRCPRRWYYQYIEKLPTPPPSEALAYGSLIHEQIEGQIQGPEPPNQDLINEPLKLYKHAIAYLNHLWRLYHAGWALVEKDIHIDTPSGIPIVGRADVVSIGRIIDHKTTSNKKYILTPEKLAQDLQANIYVYWYHQQDMQKLFNLKSAYEQKETTHFVHHYFNKKTNYASRVETPMPVKANEQFMQEKVFPATKKMCETASMDHNIVLFNEKDCWSYGQRCPFFDRCRNGQTKQEALMSATDILARIRAKKEAEAAQAAAKAAAKTLEEVVEHFEDTGEVIGLDTLSHDDKMVFLAYRKERDESEQASKELAEIAAIIPPDQAPDHLPGELVNKKGDVVSEFEHYKVAQKLITELASANIHSFEEASAMPNKYWESLVAKRGNGIGQGKVDSFLALVEKHAPQKSEEVPFQNKDPYKDDKIVQDTKSLYEEPNKKEKRSGFSLFINCDFVRMNGYAERIVRLEDVVQQLSRVVQDQQEVPHWSLSPYATGAGHLAALLKEQIADGEFEKKIIVANSFFPASSALLEVLMPEAHTIVGALR